jgi:hypothetical protein
MSTIKSSTEHLTLNADGAGKEIKFQANGVEVASISSTGNLTSTGIDDNATSTAITIDSSEKVGIGTSSPANKLEVTGAIVAQGAVTAYTNTGLYLQNKGSSVVDVGSWRSGASVAELSFSTDSGSDAAPVERMRIDSSGNVGIGTTSPEAKLHIEGSGADDSNLLNLGLDGGRDWTFRQDGTGSGTALKLVSDSGKNFLLDASRFMLRSYTGSEQLRCGYGLHTFFSSGNIYTGRTEGATYASGEKGFTAYGGSSSDYVYINARNVADTSSMFRAATSGDTKINLRADGNCYNDGAWSTSNADYAEMFEWSDGNTNADDRVGYSVVMDGANIRIATSDDDAAMIIGIVSARPAILGDSGSLGWSGKAPTDEFGRRTQTPITVYSWGGDEVTDEDGNTTTTEKFEYRHDAIPEGVTVPDDATSVVRYEDAVSDDYDPEQEYTPRQERKEWDAIGMMGKLKMHKGQPTGDRWIKMRDMSDTIEEWLVR